MSTQPPPRLVALREMASRSVDRTIDLYSTDEFLESFSAMQDQHTTLEHMYKQTKLCLHENSMAEFDQIVAEGGVGTNLNKLDAQLAQQPLLADGSRLPLTSASETQHMVAEAALPSRRQYKLALQQALQQVEEENVALQANHRALQPKLQEASAEIAACKERVEQTAVQCERWCATQV